MSKLAVAFGDVQIHNYRAYDKNTGRRLDNTLKAVEHIFDFAGKSGIEYILFVGDLFDQQKNLPTIVINKTVETFSKCFKKHPNIIFLGITGNHDQSSQQLLEKDAISSLTFLGNIFDNFVILDNKNYEIPVDKDFSGTQPVKITGIPYYEYSEHFLTRLGQVSEEVKNNSANYVNILLTHQTPTGLGNPNIPVDVDVNDPKLECFDLVLNGHIHKYQEITKKFIDVGSPIARDADDEGDEKGYLVINLERPQTRKFKSLNSEFPVIITKYSGDEMTEWEQQQYVREVPLPIEEVNEIINTSNYTADLKASEIIENFCNDTENLEKISMGLKILQDANIKNTHNE